MVCYVCFNRGLFHFDDLLRTSPDNHVELSSVCVRPPGATSSRIRFPQPFAVSIDPILLTIPSRFPTGLHLPHFSWTPAFVDDPSEIDLRDAHFHTAGNHFILHHLDYYILYHNRLKLQHYIDVLSMQIQQVNQHYQMRFLWASATANVHRRWTCALTKPWATQKTPADTYQTRWGHRFFFETDYIKEVKHPPPFIPQLTRRASFSWSRLKCLKKMCQVSSFFLSVCQKLHSDTTITLNVCGIGLLLERSCRRVFGYQLLSGFTFLVLTRCLTGVHHLQTEDQLAISSRWPTQSRFRSWSIWNFSCLTNAKRDYSTKTQNLETVRSCILANRETYICAWMTSKYPGKTLTMSIPQKDFRLTFDVLKDGKMYHRPVAHDHTIYQTMLYWELSWSSPTLCFTARPPYNS